MLDIIKHIKVGDKEYPMAFTLNVMEAIQEKYGTMDKWSDAMESNDGEPSFKDIKWTFTELFNEGIDMENEDKGTDRAFLTPKQVGRIISAMGMGEMQNELLGVYTASVGSSEGEEEGKNE